MREPFEPICFSCPHCGSENTFIPDDAAGQGPWVQDCEVCCRPILITVRRSSGGREDWSFTKENG